MFYLNNICFLCLRDEVSKPKDVNYLKVQEELEYFIPENILKMSEIPKQVCGDCIQSLSCIYRFRIQCLKNIITFNGYVNKLSEGAPYQPLSVKLSKDILPDKNAEASQEITENKDEQDYNPTVENEIFETYYFKSPDEDQIEETCKDPEEIKEEDKSNYENDMHKNLFILNNDFLREESCKVQEKSCKENDSILVEDDYNSENADEDKNEFIPEINAGSQKIPVVVLQELDVDKIYEFRDESPETYPSHNRNKKERNTCKVCHKKFPNSTSLKRHGIIHATKKPYECDVCQRSFTDARNLKVHQLVHTNEKPFRCDVCKRRFRDIRNLKVHQLIHSNEKPYECDVCKKTFRHSGTLKLHKRYHTGDRPYTCVDCQKSFFSWNGLQIHNIKVHNTKKPVNVNVCDVCGRTFNTAIDLKNHRRVHIGEKLNTRGVC